MLISVEHYHEMLRIGELEEGDPIELLDGQLVEKPKRTHAHIFAAGMLFDQLSELEPAGWHVFHGGAITMDDSEPEPDVAMVRGEIRDYNRRFPWPSETGLLVEVAHQTLDLDRGIKKVIYARGGIANYWIVNVIERQIEAFSDPSGPAAMPDYRVAEVFGEATEVPLVLDNVEYGRIRTGKLFA